MHLEWLVEDTSLFSVCLCLCENHQRVQRRHRSQDSNPDCCATVGTLTERERDSLGDSMEVMGGQIEGCLDIKMYIIDNNIV